MSKSATFERPALSAGVISWQLAQTFWVGGLWLLHFVLLPALGKYGLAPLLVEEIDRGLSPLLVGFAAFCCLLQALVLVRAERLASLWRDVRGQLLLSVLGLALVYLMAAQLLPEAGRWLQFNFTVLALCGVLLVLQPVPGVSSARQSPV